VAGENLVRADAVAPRDIGTDGASLLDRSVSYSQAQKPKEAS
jgi:hypothetical protein